MKKKIVFTFLSFLVVLFFARGGWLPSDIRLDTGDTSGVSDSWFPQVNTNGSNVYAVWHDYRNGLQDIYFNYSTNGGTTWQAPDIRLDTGDTLGANESRNPKICSEGTNVYVVWIDDRNGNSDIYFNYSTNSGVSWQASAIRLDTGDGAGANGSLAPQVCCSGENIYVVWYDGRNGALDIYFNYSTDYGATWQASDTRLDTGDSPGANGSFAPQICCSGENVYAVWEDYRNGSADIYFNYSTNGGMSWQVSAIRLDTGDTLGANNSWKAQICCSGGNVYVTWYDYRNGEPDIYFNRSADYGATWQSLDIRLDKGDTAGASQSYTPQISNSGENVYVVWHDYRNGGWSDIYFNSSKDGGSTWRETDIRLDTGDSPGVNASSNPLIESSGDNLYVVWYDKRNGGNDIYFNCSIDGGMTWKTPDIRLDTGDSPGANESYNQHLACSGKSAYVVWRDDRNGEDDIYFNTATLPDLDINANGSDGPITISQADALSITVGLDAGTFSGDDADWLLLIKTPQGWYHYDIISGWLPGKNVTLQRSLKNIPSKEIFNMSGLPAGTYIFYFAVDMTMNGSIDVGQVYYDKVKVTINP